MLFCSFIVSLVLDEFASNVELSSSLVGMGMIFVRFGNSGLRAAFVERSREGGGIGKLSRRRAMGGKED